MKRMPEIKIVFCNPPQKGLTVERKIGGIKYTRKVGLKDFISSTEASKILGYSWVHLHRLVKWQKLNPIRKRGRLYFRLGDILDFKLKKKKSKRELFLT